MNQEATPDQIQYVVVRLGNMIKQFTVWHAEFPAAHAEAVRLTREQGYNCAVLKLVGVTKLVQTPVEWTAFE